MKTELTLGDINKKYGSYENYRKTPEGILSSIETCKTLIEEEKEKLTEAQRLYEMGEPLEEVNKIKDEVAKNILWYQNKIKSLFVSLESA